MFDAILDALKIHGPIGAVILAVAYIGRERFRLDNRRHRENVDRIADLENDRVTKHDLERVFDRIEQVAGQIQTNQNVLLTALARRKLD